MGTVVHVTPRPRKKLLILSDLHWSHRDQAAWELFEAFRRAWKPDMIFSLGDMVEFSPVGSYANVDYNQQGVLIGRPEEDLAEECHGVRGVFARWRAEHPSARIAHIDGNHEFRLGRYLMGTAVPLAGLTALSIPALWEFEESRIEWVRYRGWLDLPFGRGLRLTHGESTAQQCAKTEYLKHRPAGMGMSGHVHRYEQFRWGDGQGWISNPCLCKTEVTWMSSTNWVQGWTVGEWEPEGNHLVLETVLIREKAINWRGHELRAA